MIRFGRFTINGYIAVPAALSLIFLIMAVSGAFVNSGGKKEPATLVAAIRSDPVHLNPVLASDGVSMNINSFIFNTLVRYDEKMEIVPDLAESWQILDGGRRVVFKLKKGVKWHDGKPFTALDCVFTFNAVVDENTNTYNAGLIKVEDEAIVFTAVDDYTLEAKMKKPFAVFFNNLTLLGIVPEHLLKGQDINRASFNQNPTGTGPFVFEYWKSSDQISLKANNDYFGGKPKLSGIRFRIIPSGDGCRIALISRQVDIAGLSAEDIYVMKDRIPAHLDIVKWQDFTYFYFAFDLTNPLFKDVRLRKAINYAIDTETVTNGALYGLGRPIHGPIPIPSWAYEPDVEKYDYNPALAGKLLDEAGWLRGPDGIRRKDGRKLSFQLNVKSGSNSSQSAAIFIQSYLKDAGIDVRLQALDMGALLDSLNPGKFETVVFDWVEPFDPDIYTEWQTDQVKNGMNFMSYSNSHVDVLLTEARSTFDRKKRRELYSRIQKIIADDAPYVFLWNQETVMGVSKRVKGISSPSPLGLLSRPEKVWVEDTSAVSN